MSDMKANGSAQGKQKGVHADFAARADPPHQRQPTELVTEGLRANPVPISKEGKTPKK